MENKLHDFEQSLTLTLGKKIKDIYGYVSAEFGEDTLVFKITRIIFEDGTDEQVEGEHDFPYIPAQNNDTYELHYKPDEE